MRKYLYIAGICGLTGVMLGAFGAHALKETLAARNSTYAWETAVLYHLIHAVALLAIASACLRQPDAGVRWLSKACACWTAGILLFSGSLYWLALGGPRWLGPVTPLGGVAFIAGWSFVLVAAFKLPRPPESA